VTLVDEANALDYLRGDGDWARAALGGALTPHDGGLGREPPLTGEEDLSPPRQREGRDERCYRERTCERREHTRGRAR
jgi:hypothetical protein